MEITIKTDGIKMEFTGLLEDGLHLTHAAILLQKECMDLIIKRQEEDHRTNEEIDRDVNAKMLKDLNKELDRLDAEIHYCHAGGNYREYASKCREYDETFQLIGNIEKINEYKESKCKNMTR